MRLLAALGLLLAVSCAPRVVTTAPPQTSPAAAEVSPIAPGLRVERRIRGGQIHRFEFRACEDDYIQVAMEQQGLDVISSIVDPSGEALRRVSSRERRFGPELFYTISPSDGLHAIEVRTAREDAPEGSYGLVLETVHPATRQDRRFMELDAEWYQLMEEVTGRKGSKTDYDLPESLMPRCTTQENSSQRIMKSAPASSLV